MERGREQKMFQVLIADDEEIERKVLRRKLEKLMPGELEIREAENGRRVLEEYREKPAQILILDIEMPGISGLEAAEEIRKTDRRCAVIFLTAYDDFRYAKRAIGIRAADYLLKPCDDRELLAAVEEAQRLVLLGQALAEKENEKSAGEEDRRKKNAGEEDGRKRSASEGAGETENGVTAPGEGTASGGNETGSPDPSGLRIREKVDEIVRSHYAGDLSVSDVAEKLGYTEAYFCRIFKQNAGQSFVSFLTDYRIREAKRLLSETGCTVREAGQKVGYPDPNYFTRVFRRVTGQSPSEFRQG